MKLLLGVHVEQDFVESDEPDGDVVSAVGHGVGNAAFATNDLSDQMMTQIAGISIHLVPSVFNDNQELFFGNLEHDVLLCEWVSL